MFRRKWTPVCAGVTALLIAACSSGSKGPSKDSVAVAPAPSYASAYTKINGAWTLSSFGDTTSVRGAGDKFITLIFSVRSPVDSSTVGGIAGCNQYGGPFTLTNDSIKFGALFSTKMACVDWPMQVETKFLSALAAVTTYSLSDSALVLNGTGVSLTFKR